MGAITTSTFNVPVYHKSGTKAVPLVSFSGNLFQTTNPVYTYGALVEEFYDNTFLATAFVGQLSNATPSLQKRFLRRNPVQVTPVPSVKIAIITERVAQKIKRLALLSQSNDARFLSIDR